MTPDGCAFERRHLDRRTPLRLVKKYCRAAGIDPARLGGRGIGIHSLRKTAINDAIRNGASMHEVREFAGHADTLGANFHTTSDGGWTVLAHSPRFVVPSATTSTYPCVPFTRTSVPFLIASVAPSTPTTAGMPYSLATTAPWVMRPPTSVTSPAAIGKSGVQAGSVYGATRTSPFSILASSSLRTTRARPRATPADAAVPARAPAGTPSPGGASTTSPSLVMRRGGRSDPSAANRSRRASRI